MTSSLITFLFSAFVLFVSSPSITTIMMTDAASSCRSGAGVPLLFGGSASNTMPGFYSPNLNVSNSSTFNIACVPTPECAAERSLSNVCSNPQSPYEPRECPTGYYCPTPQQSLPCPEGSYCLLASYKPTPCPFLSSCPEKSHRPVYFGGLVLLACLLLVVVAAIIWYEKCRSPSPPSEKISSASVSERKKILHRGVKRAGVDPISFEFDNLSVSVKVPGKDAPVKILKSVSGHCAPGNVYSLVGPSGCGKTTFFRALLRKFDSDNFIVTGENKVNGSTKLEDYEKLRSAIAYIPQDDVLHNELTVYDNIYYASELALPRNWSSEEREEFREVILSLLGLSRHRNTKVGTVEERGLSGGQRKRLAVACHMAGAPRAIYADEISTGLDATTALELIRILKDVAVAANISVVMVLHQPRVEIWRALDRLLVLAPGGKTVYEGPASQITTVMGEYMHLRPQDNPADVLLDVVSSHGEEMSTRWANGDFAARMIKTDSGSQESLEDLSTTSHPGESDQPENYSDSKTKGAEGASSVEKEAPIRQAHPFRQFRLMHVRVLQKMLATYQFILLEWLILLLTGLILGSGSLLFVPQAIYIAPYDRISYQAIATFLPQMLMYTKMSLGLAGAVSGVRVFGDEKIRLRRESETGLSITAYFFASTLAMMYRAFVSSTIFSVLIHFIGQWPTDFWTTIFPNLFLVYLSVNSIGEIIALLTSAEYAAVIASMIALLGGAMNGFIAFPYWLKVLSYAYWSSQQLYHAWYSQVSHVCVPPYADWDYKPDEISGADCLGVLTGMFVIYSFIVWGILMWQYRQK